MSATTAIAINLDKGANINLTKDSGVRKFTIGLGWLINNGASVDIDAIAISLNENQKLPNADYLTYFKNRDAVKGIHLSEDNLVGNPQKGTVCETITVDVSQIPNEVHFVYVMAVIFQAVQKGQNFGQINSAFIRISETESGNELAQFDLSEDSSSFNSFWLGSLYRHNGEWKFKAVGQGANGTIEDHANQLVA